MRVEVNKKHEIITIPPLLTRGILIGLGQTPPVTPTPKIGDSYSSIIHEHDPTV